MKSKEFPNYRASIEMEVLTPVHVGAGKEKQLIKGMDFLYDEDQQKVFVIDPRLLSQKILGENDTEKQAATRRLATYTE